MRIPLYQLDAFTDSRFAGNPAAVCPLETWLPDATLQAIAAENNLAETAFFAPAAGASDADYDLRWFTPTTEVALCGHATLASGAVVMERLAPRRERVAFHSASGVLTVARREDLYVLDFPAQPPETIARPADALEALCGEAEAVLQAPRGGKAMAVVADAAAVRAADPDLERVAALPADGLIVTAPGEDCDFVSRYFAPHAGIPEDPVTGSAHCVLTPYWAARLGRTELSARQLSSRGGELSCALIGDRVEIGGRVAAYLEGTIRVD